MITRWWFGGLALLALATLAPAPARSDLGVELWTDRGNDAVYRPGERMDVRTRVSEDSYLLVYEIDAEGYVRMLFPYRGSGGFVEGRRTYDLPPDDAELELVVQEPVGQGYIVALASRERFRDLPWYLRPYDVQAEGVGYEGELEEEEGVTAEGRIVGDPFVAMERIRRRVLENYEYEEDFASAYVTYYVHHAVRYPRYLCYDCHRPNQWAWWDGFDPYYAHCTVFDFRVNWGWRWGPSYWCGFVPYYHYVYRYDCPPRYRSYYANRTCYSSWDGWRRWRSLWGGRLTRYKSAPPTDYEAPTRYRDGRTAGGKTPPGFLVTDARHGRGDMRVKMPLGRSRPVRDPGGTYGKGGFQAPRHKDAEREPLREQRRDDGRGQRVKGRDRIDEGPRPIREWKGGSDGSSWKRQDLRGRMERSPVPADPWKERLVRGRMEQRPPRNDFGGMRESRREGPPRGDMRVPRRTAEPQRFERRDPPRFEHREPQRIERREQPRFEHREPQRIERREQPRFEYREPPRFEHREPPPGGHREAPRVERSEPPRETPPAPRIERRDDRGNGGSKPAPGGGKGGKHGR